MRFCFVKYAAVLCLALLINCSSAFALSASDQEARDAALRWLAMLDAGQYGKAYQARPPRLKAGGSEQQFIQWARFKRYPLGRARSRQFLKVVHTHQILGSPDGNYQIMAFKSSFDRKVNAAEMVVVTSETGHWQVSGYRVY